MLEIWDDASVVVAKCNDALDLGDGAWGGSKNLQI